MKKPLKALLVDCALISLLSGTASLAAAQPNATEDTPPAEQGGADSGSALPDCDSVRCVGAEGLLFRLRTRSYDRPRTQGTSHQSSSEALQPDRRVTVAMERPGKATAVGRFSVDLPGGGVVWATEDPTLGLPELAVSAPGLVPFDGQRITRPVQFYVRSNYPAFIKRLAITIYRGGDVDLIEPIATVPLDVAAVTDTTWAGALPAAYRFRAGDELTYVLRAYGEGDTFDETAPRRLQLVSPEEAERSAVMLRNSAERFQGTSLTTEQAQTLSLIDSVFDGNGLRQQNIALHGSRVRIQGRNIPQQLSLTINGERYPVDIERRFVAEYLVPVGKHRFDIGLSAMGKDAPTASHALEVDVTGRYFFGVGLADMTVARRTVNGSIEPFATDDHYPDDVISDGRLAFYGKAKWRGKYLITAQADTTERDLKHLFNGFTRADPQDVFRRLDPDLYYPIYGDDSSVHRDIDTMGRFYLRADWDKNQALWGNYSTGITGTEYAQYQRSLYGAALSWRSQTTNRWGSPGSELRVFGSQAQTTPGHTEFAGTGGSLYYLRHTDVLPGSDVVTLETRDPTTGRVGSRAVLQRGADYEIDELQGRILLTRPLAQMSRDNTPTLTRDAPRDGFEARLIVDYEWVPSDFDADDVTTGLRGKYWFGNHIGVGATIVDERRAGEDYSLTAADLTLQAGKGTYVKLEYAQTESFGAPVFFSDNGGLSFIQRNDTTLHREGEAKAVEARANFRELGWAEQDWNIGAWWRQVSAGYSISRYDIGRPVTEYGAELLGQITQGLRLYSRYTKAESGADSLTQLQGTLEWRIDDASTLSAELRRVDEREAVGDSAGLLGGLKYLRRFGTSVELYGLAQVTLDDDDGNYADNNALTLGGRYLSGDNSSVGAEVSTGDRGSAATVNAEYRLSAEHSVYGAYTHSTDSTQYDSLFRPKVQNGSTLGQRWRLSNQVNLYNESQFLKEPYQSGLAHTFGMDFYPAQGWNLGFTLSDGELTNQSGGNVDRRAISLSGGRSSPTTAWQSKLEWRQDQGAEQREQWVTTHRLTHKINESWRIAARLNYAETEDSLNSQAKARFIESNFGFAYRPWNSQRWGLFGRYTYLYDLASLGQMGGARYDQKSQILSFEGVYKHNTHWEFAGKLARREGEVRMGRGTGLWFDSATTFAAAQVRYELLMQWHALGEYRWLNVKEGGAKKGFLVGVDRELSKHFRFGVGYNFTDFSDKLTDFDYDHRGWFINITGRY